MLDEDEPLRMVHNFGKRMKKDFMGSQNLSADQVSVLIRQMIMDENLQPGAALPSVRQLAKQFNVSTSTVQRAISHLSSLGFVEVQPGSGTYVKRAGSGIPLPVLRKANSEQWNRLAERFPNSLLQTLSKFDQAELLKSCRWRDRLEVHHRAPETREMEASIDAGVTEPAGDAQLRSLIANRLNAARSLHSTAGDIIIVSGRSQAFGLIARLLGGSERILICERPGNPEVSALFAALGTKVSPLVPDISGILPSQLNAHTGRGQILYVSPSAQIPTGGVLPASRRQQIAQWASKTESLIIEDDYGSEFSFETRIAPAIAAAEPDRTIYVGGFEPVLPEAYRLAYLVVPPGLRETFYHAKLLADRCAPPFVQRLLLRMLKEKEIERKYREAEKQAQACRSLMSQLTINLPRGGFLQCLRVSPDTDCDRLAQSMCAIGVPSLPLSDFNAPNEHGIVFSLLCKTETFQTAMPILREAASGI